MSSSVQLFKHLFSGRSILDAAIKSAANSEPFTDQEKSNSFGADEKDRAELTISRLKVFDFGNFHDFKARKQEIV